MMNNLTDEEKREMVNIALTKAYPKIYQDFLRITSYGAGQWEDLLPFCISEFLTKKDINFQYKVACIDNKLPNYFGKAMSLNLRSSNSPFWHNYRKEGYRSRGIYLVETDSQHIKGDYDEIKDTISPAYTTDPFACMEAAIQKLDFYHKAILTDYYLNEMTYNTMNKKYGITLTSLKKAVEQGIKLVQQHCKHFI